MLHVELDGAFELLVIFVALSHFEINQVAIVVVEGKQFLLLRFVNCQILLENLRLRTHLEV